MDRQRVTVLAYVPVLHAGYHRFFSQYGDAHEFAIMGESLIGHCAYLAKEIRALSPNLVASAIRGWGIGPSVVVADESYLRQLNSSRTVVVMPDEDVCNIVASALLPQCETRFVDVFLRWNRHNVLQERVVSPHRTIRVNALDRELLELAIQEGLKSSDWWRQVGAVAVRDGRILACAHNRHMPSEHSPYVVGDPRNVFSRGVHIDLSTALHAEMGIVCEAARRSDLSLEGASLYVSTFPCPPCARAIVRAGFVRCYFSEGYAMLDGEEILRQAGIEIVLVLPQ